MSDQGEPLDQLREELRQANEAIARLRAKLVEQEHRAFPILKTFFIEQRRWPKGDPRRAAAWKAMLWRIFFSPGAVAAAGMTVGLATVVLLAVQLALLWDQNSEMKRSLAQAEEHYRLGRRTELVAVLYETTMPGGEMPLAHSRRRAEAAQEFVALERTRLEEQKSRQPPRLNGAHLSIATLVGADFRGVDFFGADFRGADLRGVDFSEANLEAADFTGATTLTCEQIWQARNWTLAKGVDHCKE